MAVAPDPVRGSSPGKGRMPRAEPVRGHPKDAKVPMDGHGEANWKPWTMAAPNPPSTPTNAYRSK